MAGKQFDEPGLDEALASLRSDVEPGNENVDALWSALQADPAISGAGGLESAAATAGTGMISKTKAATWLLVAVAGTGAGMLAFGERSSESAHTEAITSDGNTKKLKPIPSDDREATRTKRAAVDPASADAGDRPAEAVTDRAPTTVEAPPRSNAKSTPQRTPSSAKHRSSPRRSSGRTTRSAGKDVTESSSLVISQLREEAASLARIDAAIRANAYERASARLDDHGRRFADGKLVREANALRIIVDCKLKRAHGKAKASEQLAALPHDKLRFRVRAACGIEDK